MKIRKYNKGDIVRFQGQKWTVCKGGRSNPSTKSFEYKICRGAWKCHIAGNRLSDFD